MQNVITLGSSEGVEGLVARIGVVLNKLKTIHLGRWTRIYVVVLDSEREYKNNVCDGTFSEME
jgi:hypothetical protein